MLPNVDALDMFPSKGSHPHGPPLLGRVRVPTPFPGVHARMQPSDSLVPVGRGFGSPRQQPTSMRVRFVPAAACPANTPVPEKGHRIPVVRSLSRRDVGLPGAWAVLLPACRGPRPRRVRPLLARPARRGHRRLQAIQRPGHPEWHSFRGYSPTAHTLARLRIAGPVAGAVARLATGLGGLTRGRAGFAPAGRRTKFHGDIATSIPLRPALPGRTEVPIPLHDLRRGHARPVTVPTLVD
jgi:hypothetical protein